MPRQRSSRQPARRAAPAQTRSASTMAAPAPTASSTRAPPTQAQNQASSANSTTGKPPGLLAQMASTAGGVAIGSTIGHGLSNMLFGSSASEAPAQQQAAPAQQVNCEFQAREFTKCLDHADMQSCSYYLEQLKACQRMASEY